MIPTVPDDGRPASRVPESSGSELSGAPFSACRDVWFNRDGERPEQLEVDTWFIRETGPPPQPDYSVAQQPGEEDLANAIEILEQVARTAMNVDWNSLNRARALFRSALTKLRAAR